MTFLVTTLRRDARHIESDAVAIENFVWTAHALLRLDERHLSRFEIEQAIREGQDGQQANDGQADWLMEGITTSGFRLELSTTILLARMRRPHESCPHGEWGSRRTSGAVTSIEPCTPTTIPTQI